MRHPVYTETKNSSVVWIGNVPKHWELRRLKFSALLVNEKIDAKQSELEYMGLEHIESWKGKRLINENSSSDGIGSKFIKNDVLFGKLRPYLAKVFLAENAGIATTEALVLRANEGVNPEYLKYYLLSKDFINIVDSSTYGAKMPRANWDFIGNLQILVPGEDEQKVIVEFLNHKTKQIDQLIEKKKALIEKLNEQRIAVITHAVTKGLDETVPMKDSGIDWLGQVPEHWDVRKLKFVASYNDESLSETTEPEKEIQYVEISSVNHVEGITAIESTTFEKAPSRARRIVRYGDTIISTVRTYLKAISAINNPPDNMIVSTGFAVIRPMKLIDSAFLSYFLSSQGFIDAVVANSKGVSYPAINTSELICIHIAFPEEKAEQKRIADYIDQQMERIDNMLRLNKQAIVKLEEYRTALITNAVTGKIDVRSNEFLG